MTSVSVFELPCPVDSEKDLIALLAKNGLQLATNREMPIERFYDLTSGFPGIILTFVPRVTVSEDGIGAKKDEAGEPVFVDDQSCTARFYQRSQCAPLSVATGPLLEGQRVLVKELEPRAKAA